MYKRYMADATKTFTVRTVGKCRRCSKGHSGLVFIKETRLEWRPGFPPPRPIISENWHAAVMCCGRHVLMQKVIGRKTATPCDVRCTEAKGHKCECSCGGANHGAGHSAEAAAA